MIRVFRSGFLTFYKNKFKCSFGKNGFTKNKKEGDLKTPLGRYKIIECYYRPDRVKKPITKIRCVKIAKTMGWCDDPKSEKYNRLIKLPFKFSHEKLTRKDNCYDIFIVINYNTKPIKKNLGSAIFIHISRPKYKPTNGCIGLKKSDLLLLLKDIKKNTKIQIT